MIAGFLVRPETAEAIKALNIQIEPNQVASAISRAKAKGLSAADFTKEAATIADNDHGNSQRIIADVYTAYTQELKASNSLDFDDLLVYGVSLLAAHPNVVKNITHVLVDELYVILSDRMCSRISAKRITFPFH